MRSHTLSRAIRTVAVVLFAVTADTFAQSYGYPTLPSFSTSTPGASPSPTAPIAEAVTTADLVTAGFTDPVPQAASGNVFQGPVRYFRVRETVRSSAPAWGAAADLIAVTMLPIGGDTWRFNNGQAQTFALAGRFQVRHSRPGVYIVVTGPDPAKLGALAEVLRTK